MRPIPRPNGRCGRAARWLRRCRVRVSRTLSSRRRRPPRGGATSSAVTPRSPLEGDAPPRDRAPRTSTPSLATLLRVRRPDLRVLAGGVAFLAVLELLVGGYLLPAVRQPFEGRPIVYWTSMVASFSRNLAAILGVVLAALYVWSFVRDSSFGRPSRRFTLGVLAVLAIPIQALSLLVQVTPEMVFMSYTATFFLSALTVLTAAQFSGPLGPRIGVGVVLMPPATAFLQTVLA